MLLTVAFEDNYFVQLFSDLSSLVTSQIHRQLLHTNMVLDIICIRQLKREFKMIKCLVWFMVFNATFNNISVISWQSVLLVEKTRVPKEKHWPVASHWQTLSHNIVSSTSRLSGFKLTTSVVIGSDCIVSYKSNYHMITTMTALINCLEIF